MSAFSFPIARLPSPCSIVEVYGFFKKKTIPQIYCGIVLRTIRQPIRRSIRRLVVFSFFNIKKGLRAAPHFGGVGYASSNVPCRA